MADKLVYVGGMKLGHANKAEVSPDITDAEEIKTFDGTIVETPESVAWNVSVDKLRYDTTIASYKQVETLLLSMFKEKKSVKVVENSKMEDGSKLRVTSVVYNCAIKDKKYTIDPTSKTVENLSFKGSPCDTWVNGEKLPRV